MGRETVSFRTPDRTREQVHSFAEERGHNQTEAWNQLVRDGLRQHGFNVPTVEQETLTERILHETARAALIAAAVLVAVSLRSDVRLFAVGLALLITGVVCWGIEEAEVLPALRRHRAARTDGGER